MQPVLRRVFPGRGTSHTVCAPLSRSRLTWKWIKSIYRLVQNSDFGYVSQCTYAGVLSRATHAHAHACDDACDGVYDASRRNKPPVRNI
jgi:hypothetical protein